VILPGYITIVSGRILDGTEVGFRYAEKLRAFEANFFSSQNPYFALTKLKIM
jgi:hypothetical protein